MLRYLAVTRLSIFFYCFLCFSADCSDGLAEVRRGIQGFWSFANRRLSGQIEELRLSDNPTLHFGWLLMLAGWRLCWKSSYSRCILGQLLVKKVKVKDSKKKFLTVLFITIL